MITERLLNGVLHLFALQTRALSDGERMAARRRVLAYLKDHVGVTDADAYIGLFDDLVELHEAEPDAAILERVVELGARLGTLLRGIEREAVMLRFLEMAALAPVEALPARIAQALGERLGLSASWLATTRDFMAAPERMAQTRPNVRLYPDDAAGGLFHGRFALLRHESGPLLIVPLGTDTLHLEGRALSPRACYLVSADQVLRDRWGNELPVAVLIAEFSRTLPAEPRAVMCGEALEFRFADGSLGLHELSFQEEAGRLVAIMGASGSGKSTLLGVLNGTLTPDRGVLRFNGLDVQTAAAALEGVFGFIPQDDLLFEDLTVFDNLYFAARFSLAHLTEPELRARVLALLEQLGQAEIAHLRVGSPLEKIISGGQRKRLNIALELIREPTLLFVDEPTSGLSSADAELVMTLLKQQAALGRLVFVVIHQPSSRIFRMFDALWILDQGGRLIFRGTPLEALVYFRRQSDWPDAEAAICAGCGHVNPEQLFDIIEEKRLDPSGRPTRERRRSPADWYRLYREHQARTAGKPPPPVSSEPLPPPRKALFRPGRSAQTRLFFTRDLRARLANRSYLAITLLEPPLLGLVLGVIARGAFGGTYAFHDNGNIPAFLFMSVIVALFLGLSISAEEICRDARIQQRERFLHLSWWSYINAKLIYLALVAMLQMALYLSVALPLVELPGFFLHSWVILSACAFASSLLGLNISATLRSDVTIYILIPLLLVPQMLLSGVIVPFDDLIPSDSRRREVPVYADLLPSRWGYEALVVEQYGANPYRRHFLEVDARIKLAEHDLDFYLPALQSRVQALDLPGTSPDSAHALVILRHELGRLSRRLGLPLEVEPAFWSGSDDSESRRGIDRFLTEARRRIFDERRAASTARRAIEQRLEASLGRAALADLKTRYTNAAIERQVLDPSALEPIGEARDGLIQRRLPIYRMPESRLGRAHFMAGHKRIGGWVVPTYPFNLAAILVLSLVLYLALGFRWMPNLASSLAARARRAQRGG